MNRIEVPNSDRSPRTRSSTSASTVASSPVVGSSRIRSVGSVANAMAMTTRCCMPPESWCGYLAITESGSAICTFRSMPIERSRASPRPMPRTVKTSAIWVPIRRDGFSAAPGFW